MNSHVSFGISPRCFRLLCFHRIRLGVHKCCGTDLTQLPAIAKSAGPWQTIKVLAAVLRMAIVKPEQVPYERAAFLDCNGGWGQAS